LHQLDTFYNALNSKDQDSLNSTAGGNVLDKMSRECLAIIESKSKVCYSHNKPVVSKVSTNTSTFGISPDVVELKDMVKALLLDKKIEESYVTCGGAHSYRNCPATDGNVYRDNIQEFVSQASAVNYNQGYATDGNVYRDNIQEFVSQASAVNYNQGNTSYRPPMMSNQIRPPGFPPEDFSAYIKTNDAVMRNMQTQGQNKQNQLTNLTELITKFMNSNNASTSSSGTLPCNTIANPRSDLKAIATRKCFADALILMPKFGPSIKILLTNNDKLYELAKTPLNEHCSAVLLKKLPEKLGDPDKFLIPCDFLGKAQCLALADLRASINLMPLSVWNKLSLPDLSPTCMTLDQADRLISHPIGVAEDVYIGRALIDVFEGELSLRVGKEAITFNPDKISRYSANYSDMMAKRIDVIDMAGEEYSQEV
nr:reverse transcriptase domain-containing protein [Tanacetum cinerariifolium]